MTISLTRSDRISLLQTGRAKRCRGIDLEPENRETAHPFHRQSPSQPRRPVGFVGSGNCTTLTFVQGIWEDPHNPRPSSAIEHSPQAKRKALRANSLYGESRKGKVAAYDLIIVISPSPFPFDSFPPPSRSCSIIHHYSCTIYHSFNVQSASSFQPKILGKERFYERTSAVRC